jgi:hypothetical protein
MTGGPFRLDLASLSASASDAAIVARVHRDRERGREMGRCGGTFGEADFGCRNGGRSRVRLREAGVSSLPRAPICPPVRRSFGST